MKRGKLFIIAGPSGVGKKTLVSKLMLNPELNLVFSVSCTTRDKRYNEVHGVDYFFISKEEFEEKIKRNEMLEYAQFFGNYYGTCKNYVEERLVQGKNVLLEIETLGFRQIKEKFPDILSIFVAPKTIDVLEQGLKHRGTEDSADIKMRLEKAVEELKEAHLFTYVVVNDVLEKAIFEIQNIFLKATSEA